MRCLFWSRLWRKNTLGPSFIYKTLFHFHPELFHNLIYGWAIVHMLPSTFGKGFGILCRVVGRGIVARCLFNAMLVYKVV